MNTRFITFDDRFEMRCKKCGGIDVDWSEKDCHECGSYTYAKCRSCGNEFDYHKFETEDIAEKQTKG